MNNYQVKHRYQFTNDVDESTTLIAEIYFSSDFSPTLTRDIETIPLEYGGILVFDPRNMQGCNTDRDFIKFNANLNQFEVLRNVIKRNDTPTNKLNDMINKYQKAGWQCYWEKIEKHNESIDTLPVDEN